MSTAPAPAATPAHGASIDPKLVQLARNEVRTVVQEIAQLARRELAPRDFYREFLARIIEGLAATGGAVWAAADGGLRAEAQQGLSEAQLVHTDAARKEHAALLEHVLAQKSPLALAPGARLETGEGESGPFSAAPENKSAHLLLFAPLVVQGRVTAIVEIFQRPGASPVTQRGYLRFLEQMAEIADGWLQKHALREYGAREELWSQWHAFVRTIHSRLEVRPTALAIVNECRRLLDCDRVTLVLRHGSGWRIEAVSGQGTLDARSRAARDLERLAGAVGAAGEPLWHASGGSLRDLAPRVEKAMESYQDQSATRGIGVIPLLPPRDEADRKKPAPLGALVLERIESAEGLDALRERAGAAAEHAGSALHNALAHGGNPLVNLLRFVGQARLLVAMKNLPKTILVVGALLLVGIALVAIPAELELQAPGRLVPQLRRDVFARADGDIVKVHIRHGQRVKQGEPLVELRNVELELRGAALAGERLKTREQLHAVEQGLLGERKLPEADRLRLHGERLQLEKQLDGLDRQWKLHLEQRQDLVVRSPLDGQVVTWAVDDLLLHRPVRRGDGLLSVVDPDSPWELELRIPEDRMGHVGQAWREQGTKLPAHFVFASDASRQLTGTVQEIEFGAEVRGEDGNSVLARVAVDRSQLSDPRFGAEVTAKIPCGSHSLGYVWLHDPWAVFQKRVLFKLK